MTGDGNGRERRYSVKFSTLTKEVLKQLHLQAAQAGGGPRFVTSSNVCNGILWGLASPCTGCRR